MFANKEAITKREGAQHESLLVGIPTRDGQIVIYDVFELFTLDKVFGRLLRFLIGEAGNIPKSRNLDTL